jgi:hypothetical protein
MVCKTARMRTLKLVPTLLLTLLLALTTACSDDESSDDASTDTAAAATDDTTAATDDTTAATDDSTDTTVAADSSEIGTTELLDFLNGEDAAIGALFDWNTGDGVIGVTYLGNQEVGLYAVEIDEATALTACELASEYTFSLDPEANITVYTGGYSEGTAVVTRTGEAGTCAAA